MRNKYIFSLKTAIVSLLLSLAVVIIVYLGTSKNILTFIFPLGIFLGSFLYGMFISDRENRNSIFYLIGASVLWIISISSLFF